MTEDVLNLAAVDKRSAGIRQERAEATRANLVDAARIVFAQAGFHATSIPDVVTAAAVTRGALYHHFASKEDLFEAVFRRVAEDIGRQAGIDVAGLTSDPWRQMRTGLQSYLALITGSLEAQRILLIDGPAVLGWVRWRRIQSNLTLGNLSWSLERLMAGGIISHQPIEPLGQLILSALNEAAMSIAHASDADRVRQEMIAALMSLVDGLRATESPPSRALSAQT